MSRRSRVTSACFVLGAMLLSIAPARAATLTFSDSFGSYPLSTSWRDGSLHGAWKDVYGGYGHVGIVQDGSHALYEQPRVSTSPGETHASLVTTRTAYANTLFTLQMRTAKQVRTGSRPNPWEVAWAFWHYTDDTHFYSVVLKPNGWELGKEDPAYDGAQRYLATGSTPRFPVGRWYTLKVLQIGPAITVWVNGVRLVTATDTERPYLSGALGLYNEDANVRFDNVRISTP